MTQTRDALKRGHVAGSVLLGLIVSLAAGAVSQYAMAAAGGNAAARLTARPATPTGSCTPGLRPLGLGGERDGVLFVPSAAGTNSTNNPTATDPTLSHQNQERQGSATQEERQGRGNQQNQPAKRLPLVVLLHGAGGSGERVIRLMQTQAERDGFLLLAPDSRGPTWDALLRSLGRGSVGPDIVFLNSALEHVFAQCAVDPSRLALAGFSDGATYTLFLGRLNGDLFTELIAFSPGGMTPADGRGRPRIFVSHGTRDKILPIDGASRVFVPELQREGYRVRYREFKGPHTVPPEIVEEAVAWFAGRK